MYLFIYLFLMADLNELSPRRRSIQLPASPHLHSPTRTHMGTPCPPRQLLSCTADGCTPHSAHPTPSTASDTPLGGVGADACVWGWGLLWPPVHEFSWRSGWGADSCEGVPARRRTGAGVPSCSLDFLEEATFSALHL